MMFETTSSNIKGMNSFKTYSTGGDFLRIHLIQNVMPWFISNDGIAEARTFTESNGEIARNTFVEYYY